MAGNGNRNGLNLRQKQFVKEYLIDFNAMGAAIRSGYSQKRADQSGYQLLRSIGIQKAIQVEVDKRAERTEITADYVLSSLKSVAERCMQEEPVLDKEGNPTGEYQFRDSGANKALELLGKNLKLFTDRLDITITLEAAWERATDAEKVSLIEKIESTLPKRIE